MMASDDKPLGHARGRDYGRPRVDGVRELGMGRRVWNVGPVIVPAPAHHWPAIVTAGLEDVELVAAHWSELVLPQLAGLRVDGRPLRIAVAIGPDLRARVFAADERIVGGHRTVGIDAYDLAEMSGEVLCWRELEALAQGDKQFAVRGEDKARAEMIRPIDFRKLPELMCASSRPASPSLPRATAVEAPPSPGSA
jgi:hypothetical protein